MARDHARVNVTIWGDPDWRELPPAAQHLYMTLWTSPDLTYCGTHDWRPSRVTGLSRGWTKEHVEMVNDCLRARHFTVTDPDTEETLIRSWVRWDGLLKQPRMAISCVSAYAAVSSPIIRQVIAYELNKERERLPHLACWQDSRVLDVLSHPSVSAKDLPLVSDPFGDDFGTEVSPGLALGLPQTQGEVWGSVYTPPTPAPTPAPKNPSSSGPRRKPEMPLPKDWQPTDKHREMALGLRLDIDREAFRFRNHATANDRRQRDWNATFTTWLDRATDYKPAPKTKHNPDMPECWQ